MKDLLKIKKHIDIKGKFNPGGQPVVKILDCSYVFKKENINIKKKESVDYTSYQITSDFEVRLSNNPTEEFGMNTRYLYIISPLFESRSIVIASLRSIERNVLVKAYSKFTGIQV